MKRHIIWLLIGLLCLLLLCFVLRGCNSSNTPEWAMQGVNAQQAAIGDAGQTKPQTGLPATPDTAPPTLSGEPAQTDTSTQTAPANEAPQLSETSGSTAAATSETTDTSPVNEVADMSASESPEPDTEGAAVGPTDESATSSRELRVSRPYMRGEDVRELQDMLIVKGYDTGKADGIYGPRTAQAVKLFQGDAALYMASDPQYGVVDAATWDMLKGGKAQ